MRGPSAKDLFKVLNARFAEGGEVDIAEQMTVGTIPEGMREPGKAEGAFRALVEAGQGFLGLEPGRRGTEAYRTGQALSNLPVLALPAAAVKGTGKASQMLDKMRVSKVFDEVDQLPRNQYVDDILSAHIGGVGDFGDETAKYALFNVPQGPEYTKQVQTVVKKNLGDRFMGYRLMSKDQFEDMQAGDIGDLMSFSLSPTVAENLKNFVKNQNRKDLVVAQVPLTPDHVIAFGSRGEQEIIVDTGVGWSLDEFKLAPPVRKRQAGSPPEGEVPTDDYIQQMMTGEVVRSASDFGPEMLQMMRKERLDPRTLQRVPLPKGSPYTATAGLPGLRTYVDPELTGTDTAGYVFGDAPPSDTSMFLRKDKLKDTVGHEAEHLLAAKQLGHPTEINSLFDSLVDNKKQGNLVRSRFVKDAVDLYPYLKEKYGLQSAYFDPRMYDFQKKHGAAQNLLFEQLASLSAIETTQNVDLTKDPELRKTLFRDKEVREVYGALTGLRQTRLDSKDIRPHTRIPETEPSLMDRAKKSLGFSAGGEVTNDEFIQQMMVGTVPEDLPRSRGLLPKEIREAVDVPLDFLNLGVRGMAGMVAGPAYGLYQGVTGGKYGTPEGVREAGSKAGEMMQRITGVPKTETARDVLEFAQKTMEPAKIPFMPQFLTMPTPGPGAARALMKSYELAETPPEGAVKPRGGLFAGEDRPESGLNKYLKSTADAADQLVSDNDLTPDRAQTIQGFIAKQGKKYLTTTYGTAFDPLREALLSGRAPRLGKDRATFKEYLMEGLGSKKDRVASEAREDFEKLYDQKTGIEATSFVGDSNYKIGQAIRDAEKQKMIDEGARLKEGGLEDFEINPIHVVDQNLENMERSWSPQYKKDLAALLKATPEGQEKSVTDPLARGLLEGEVLYDVKPYGLDALEPKNAVNALAALTDEELKKRDFPEAIIEGMKRTRLVREWDEVLDRAEKNKPINKELFDLGVEDVLPMGDDRWVRVMTKPAVQLEGKAMHHSVGGYANKVYNLGGKEAFNSGKARVFSLRGSDGYPRITVEARHLDDGKLDITQIKGRYNGLPTPEDQQKTIGFLLTMPISSVKSFESYSMDTNGKKLPESVEVEWRDMYQKAVQQQQE
jgi:hypothetical protein